MDPIAAVVAVADTIKAGIQFASDQFHALSPETQRQQAEANAAFWKPLQDVLVQLAQSLPKPKP